MSPRPEPAFDADDPLARALGAGGPVRARPEFRGQLRERLLARPPVVAPRPWWLGRPNATPAWLTVLALLVGAAILTGIAWRDRVWAPSPARLAEPTLVAPTLLAPVAVLATDRPTAPATSVPTTVPSATVARRPAGSLRPLAPPTITVTPTATPTATSPAIVERKDRDKPTAGPTSAPPPTATEGLNPPPTPTERTPVPWPTYPPPPTEGAPPWDDAAP